MKKNEKKVVGQSTGVAASEGEETENFIRGAERKRDEMEGDGRTGRRRHRAGADWPGGMFRPMFARDGQYA